MRDVKARQLAIDTRQRLGLQSTEYCDVDRALTTLGVTCVKRPLQSSMSGATLKTDKVRLILLNTSKTLGHQHFTVAHELYHVLYDENLTTTACKVESFESASHSEQVADAFAVHLLMPEDGVLNQLRIRGWQGREVTIADVVHLEQYFAVSRRAMCWRLKDLGHISREQEDRFCVNVVRSASELGKDIALYRPTGESGMVSDYAEKAAEAVQKGLITEARQEELLADAKLLEEMTEAMKEVDVVD